MTKRKLNRIICRLIGHQWKTTEKPPEHENIFIRTCQCQRCKEIKTRNLLHEAIRFQSNVPKMK